MLSFVVLLLLPIILIILLPKLSKNGRKAWPPGPRGLPIIGNMHQLDNSALHIYLHNLSKKYGPLMSLKLASRPVIVASSASMAEEVLKNHDLECCSRPSLVAHRRLSYNGLDIALAPYNEYWREMRKVCVLHLLSSKRVQSFRSIREDEVFSMIKNIQLQAVGATNSTKPANLSKIIMELTSAIICKIAFGKKYGSEGNVRSKFHQLLDENQAMLGGFFVSDYFPLIGWVDKLTGMIQRLEKNFREMDAFYQNIIDEHLEPTRQESKQEDIVDILLKLREENYFAISFDRIKALLMNIFIAGTETSGATLIWAMTALIKNSRVMKKVQKEIRELIGKKSFVDEDDIEKLPYLKAVVKETLRLYNPAPLLVPHETTQNCNINGYEIEPKTIIYVNAWAIARDPKSWENPEDFFPERFLNNFIDYRGLDLKFIPFGAGRRSCPGMSFGATTVELTLSNLLHKFDWELPAGMAEEDIDIDVKVGLTVIKKNDLCLVPKIYVQGLSS